jgi:hypothetical protein
MTDIQELRALSLDQLKDERDTLRGKFLMLRQQLEAIKLFCNEHRYDTSFLATNPPQNPVAFRVGVMAHEALTATEDRP